MAEKRPQFGRYGFPLMFVAGFASVCVIAASAVSGFAPDEEIWLSAALIFVLILHARLGYMLNNARSEIEILQCLSDRVDIPKKEPKSNLEQIDAVTDENAMTEGEVRCLSRVRDSITAGRIDLYLQPIVSLPQRKVRFYEAFSRLRDQDGRILKPMEYLDAAEKANRINVIDNVILMRCIQALRQQRARDPRLVVFCNLSPATLFDREFFGEFTEYLEANSDLASNLVFEFTYPAIQMLHPRAESNLKALAKRGYTFSVDHLHSLNVDWTMLRDRNFRYAKASARMLLASARGSEEEVARLGRFRKQLRDAEIDLIAEKIELEAHMPEITALALDYGQGNLFGPARQAEYYLGDDGIELNSEMPIEMPARAIA